MDTMILRNLCNWRSTSLKSTCDHYIKGGFCSRSDMFRCTEYLARNMPSLSYSAIRDYTRCKRRFLYAWIWGLESIDKPKPLMMGSLASKILGILHDAKIDPQEALSQYTHIITKAIEESINPDQENDEGSPDLWAMRAFFDAYISKDRHTLKGQTEFEFHWNDPEYPKLHGFIDLRHHETMACEFKWTGNPDWYNKFHCQEQSSAYFIGAPELESIAWILLQPPTLRIKKDETVHEYYERVKADAVKRMDTVYITKKTYWRTEFDLDMYKEKAKLIAREIMSNCSLLTPQTNAEWLFYQNDNGCFTPGMCDFLKICEFGVIPLDQFTKRERR